MTNYNHFERRGYWRKREQAAKTTVNAPNFLFFGFFSPSCDHPPLRMALFSAKLSDVSDYPENIWKKNGHY
ncbi:hypothetical protein [Yersinia pekkanenii]|uniref:hypothetical protein n=1 Tax=Yersinia pekkanenii TaxID=1288385 RepID=UPI0012E0064B|nr:hypothetical protein [Yersinia pekkanenii]